MQKVKKVQKKKTKKAVKKTKKAAKKPKKAAKKKVVKKKVCHRIHTEPLLFVRSSLSIRSCRLSRVAHRGLATAVCAVQYMQESRCTIAWS